MSNRFELFPKSLAMAVLCLVCCSDFRFRKTFRVVHLFPILMKKFFQNILLFVAVILLLAVVVDFVVSSGLKRTERGHFFTMNALMNEKMDADVVILGNSRAVGSYNPYVLDTMLGINSRNLGVSGQPFGVSYLRWQLYHRNNTNPKLLIVNIDFRELRMVTKGCEKEQYYPYMTDTLVRPYLDLYGFTWAEKHVPMYRYRGDYKLMSIGFSELLHIRHDQKGNYYKGYTNENTKWDGRNLNSLLNKGKIKGQCEPEAVQLLEHFLQETISEGIPVVFVYAPLYKKLKDNLAEEDTLAAYQDLSQRYDIPLLDFSEIDFCSDSSYFMNGHHVNRKGAQRFSEELAVAIDSLGLLQR